MGVLAFSVDPRKNLIFSMQLVFFTVDKKNSQTETFYKRVFFMFCLEHFSLKCIIKNIELKINPPLTWCTILKSADPLDAFDRAIGDVIDMFFLTTVSVVDLETSNGLMPDAGELIMLSRSLIMPGVEHAGGLYGAAIESLNELTIEYSEALHLFTEVVVDT